MQVIVEVGTDAQQVCVVKDDAGAYSVIVNNVVRHPAGDAECAMRALGQYLHSALYQLEKVNNSANT